MQRTRFIALSDDADHIVVKIDILQVEAMNFTDAQAELIHQGINGKVTDTQDGVDIDVLEEKADLVETQGVGSISIAGTDFEHIIKRQCISTGQVILLQEVAVASEGEDFSIDRCAAIVALMFKVILKVHYYRTGDGFLLLGFEKIFEIDLDQRDCS